MSDFNLGTVTAYGYAKDKGYTGTEDEYAELMASYADVAEQAAESATQAAASATTATAKASEAAQSATAAASSKTAAETAQGGAETAAQTATTKAGEASTAATTASGKATEATTAAGTATTKASEATTAATTATTKAGEASTSATNAAASATRAQEILDSIPEDYTELTEEVSNLKDDISDVKDAFAESVYNIPLSAYAKGYINTSGSVSEMSACEYASANIDTDLVGKTLLISGSAWWAIKPFVFVADDESIEYADVSDPGGTETQYTDLEFVPKKTGTLYVNRYNNGRVVHNATAKYLDISNIKIEYIPNDISDVITDAISYKPVALTLTQKKLLSGETGAITDTDGTMYYVSDYVDVSENAWYLISTEHFWSNGLYAWYDENKVFISGFSANSGGTITKFYCKKVKSPANARYLVIGFLYQANYTFPFLMEGEMRSILPSKRWSGKKWACIGDSLTEAYSRTGAHYFDLISAVTGITAVNMGVSGTGYARGTDNFMTRALTVPTDSDVVTFFGSGNDSGAGLDLGTASDTGTSTLGGCINTAIDNLYSVMPVVQLGIITPTPWQGNMPSDNGWMASYSNLIVDICKSRSIPCLDLFHCANLNPNSAEVRTIAYARDDGGGVHPSEAGHAIIAPRIQAFLDTLLLH